MPGRARRAVDETARASAGPGRVAGHWWGPAGRVARHRSRCVRPMRRSALSGSAVAAFDQCPRAWFLDREVKATETTSTAQGFGSIVHALAEAVVVGELPPDLDALVERLDSVWPSLPYDARWQAARDASRGRARRSSGSWPGTPHNPRECAGAELEFDGAGRRRHRDPRPGRPDRARRARAARRRRPQDRRSTRPPMLSRSAHEPQLGVYQLAVREGALRAAGRRRRAAPSCCSCASRSAAGARCSRSRRWRRRRRGSTSWSAGVAAEIRAEAFPARAERRAATAAGSAPRARLARRGRAGGVDEPRRDTPAADGDYLRELLEQGRSPTSRWRSSPRRLATAARHRRRRLAARRW